MTENISMVENICVGPGPGTCLTNVLISITGPERDHHHRQELGIFQIITLTMTADSSYIF